MRVWRRLRLRCFRQPRVPRIRRDPHLPAPAGSAASALSVTPAPEGSPGSALSATPAPEGSAGSAVETAPDGRGIYRAAGETTPPARGFVRPRCVRSPHTALPDAAASALCPVAVPTAACGGTNRTAVAPEQALQLAPGQLRRSYRHKDAVVAASICLQLRRSARFPPPQGLGAVVSTAATRGFCRRRRQPQETAVGNRPGNSRTRQP